MKRTITTICLILSAILILDSLNVWHALIMFYLAGEIPGTRQSVSASTMMELFALLIGFVIARITSPATRSLVEHMQPRLKTKRA
jgi:hypothetical protein